MDWDFILESVVTFLLSVYLMIEGIVKAVLPDSSTATKDVSKDIVLVTGAGSGIGRLLALRFARLGSTLVLWDINKEGNEATAEEIRKGGGTAHAYLCDISSRKDVYAAADRVRQDVGNVTILVNNAGIVSGKKFLQTPDSLIEKCMHVNAMSHFWTVKAFLPAMLDTKRGHIVSTASSAGIIGVSGLADYCASKFAAVGFMDALGAELDSMQETIYTTTVCPYIIDTGMFEGVKTRFPRLLSILQPEYVADRIMVAILSNQEVVYIPRILYVILPLKSVLPVKAVRLLCHYLGASSMMDTFKGRPVVKSG